MIRIVKLSLFFLCTLVHAGGVGLQDGTDFANSIKPSDNTHLVNPSTLNQDNAWGSGTAPTTVPSGLGAFSNPVNDNSVYNSAKGIGIAGLGLQTQADCSNYVPGQSKERDQQCAAVNFMSNRCTPVSATQMEVFKKIPRVSGASNDCNGTYGQGASMFNYAAQMTKKDNIFNNANGARQNASTVAGSDCSIQDVQTSPAKFETKTCSVTRNVTEEGCSKNLHVTVNNNFTCVKNTFPTSSTIANIQGGDDYNVIEAGCSDNLTAMSFRIRSCDVTDGCIAGGNWRGFSVDMSKPVSHAPSPESAYEYMSGWYRYKTTYSTNGCDSDNNCSITFEFWVDTSSCQYQCTNTGGGFFGGGQTCGVVCTSSSFIKRTLTLSFKKFYTWITYTDTWDNQCAPFEARSK